MKSPRRRIAGELGWVVTGQGAAALGMLVGVRALTEVLSPAEYGELALGITLATLAEQILMAPLSGAFMRFFAPAKETGAFGPYLKAVRYLLVRASTFLLLLGALACGVLALMGSSEALAVVAAATLLALPRGLEISLDSMQTAARQRTVVAWHLGLGAWLRFGMALVFFELFGHSAAVGILGYAVASAIVLGSQSLFFRGRLASLAEGEPVGPDGSWSPRMWAYALPSITWGVFTWGQIASDRWALGLAEDASAVGLYNALYQVGYFPILLLTGAVVQLVSPILFAVAGEWTDNERRERTRSINDKLMQGCVALTVAATVVAFVAHDLVFDILVDEKYHEVSYLLPWMIAAGGAFALGQIASQLLMAGLAPKRLLRPKIVTAALAVMGNALGATLFGIEGVVAAVLLFSIVYSAWTVLLGRSVMADTETLAPEPPSDLLS